MNGEKIVFQVIHDGRKASFPPWELEPRMGRKWRRRTSALIRSPSLPRLIMAEGQYRLAALAQPMTPYMR